MRQAPIRYGRRLPLIALLALSLACATGGAPQVSDPEDRPPADVSDVGSAPDNPDTGSTKGDPATPDPGEPTPKQAQRGPSKVRQHAESGVEGMIVGTVIGGQVGGTTGAAVGAAIFGLYGLVTGDVPFESGQGGPRGRRGGTVDDSLEREVEDELERQRALESEIEEELRRQEELLESISRQEELNESLRREEEDKQLAAERESDPLAAPVAEVPRKIPDSIFDTEYRSDGEEERIVKTLDADRDGRPEIVIGMDGKSGQLMTRSEDTNYDGELDSTTSYGEDGQIAGLGGRVEVDRDFDGVRDGFYTYEGGQLAYEEHDTNNDGVIDRRVEYEARHRTLELEDRDFNGTMDFRTFYDANAIPIRTELDTNEDGQTDVWEYYEGADPANILLVRKEEDLNSDGEVDVTSHYSDGKLIRKEINDPSFY
jgi:hypothetical protein